MTVSIHMFLLSLLPIVVTAVLALCLFLITYFSVRLCFKNKYVYKFSTTSV